MASPTSPPASSAALGEDQVGAKQAVPEKDPAKLLAAAQALYDALEYDQVAPLTLSVLAHEKATIDHRLDAYLLQGSSLAVIGDPIEAEKPFRYLLRGRPTYVMPEDTPPKILAVFRKVHFEEVEIRRQMQELERARLMKTLALAGELEPDLVGGVPIAFDVGVRDPRGVVRAVDVHYRRRGDQQYGALPLERGDGGKWRGHIPGEWSESDEDFELEYFLVTLDVKGQALLGRGSDRAPERAHVGAGTIAGARPFYKSWWFWGVTTGAAAALTLGAASSAFAVAYLGSQPPASDLGTAYID